MKCSAISSNRSVKVGTQQWYTVPVSILTYGCGIRADYCSVDGGRCALPTPAIDDGVRAPRRRRRRRHHRRRRRRLRRRSRWLKSTRLRPRRKHHGKSPLNRRTPASSAPEPAGVPGGVIGARGWRHSGAPPPAAAAGSAGPRRRQHQAADEDQGRSGLSIRRSRSQRACRASVIIEATIGPNGKVQDARVLRSIPLLDCGGARRGEAVGVHA